jgi:hypothetical protein
MVTKEQQEPDHHREYRAEASYIPGCGNGLAMACSLHVQGHMVEAIRDQWVIVAGIVVVAAVVAWLVMRR